MATPDLQNGPLSSSQPRPSCSSRMLIVASGPGFRPRDGHFGYLSWLYSEFGFESVAATFDGEERADAALRFAESWSQRYGPALKFRAPVLRFPLTAAAGDGAVKADERLKAAKNERRQRIAAAAIAIAVLSRGGETGAIERLVLRKPGSASFSPPPGLAKGRRFSFSSRPDFVAVPLGRPAMSISCSVEEVSS